MPLDPQAIAEIREDLAAVEVWLSHTETHPAFSEEGRQHEALYQADYYAKNVRDKIREAYKSAVPVRAAR